jgi:glycosyltransferase involved in cell wall biosynthesis
MMFPYSIIYAARKNIPYVVQPHGAINWRSNKWPMKLLYDLLIGRPLLARADCLIAQQSNEHSELQSMFSTEVEVVPNGVSRSNCDLSREGEFRKEHNIRPDTILILYLGRLSKRKGVYMIPDIGNQLSQDYRIFIAGPDETDGNLLNKISQTKNVEYVGFLSESDKRAALTDSDIFILPTKYGEGMPTTILEAMAHKTTCVVSRECNSEFLRTENVGFITDPTVKSFVKTISEINTGEIPELSKKARKLVLERFTWEQNSQKLTNIYKDVIAKK